MKINQRRNGCLEYDMIICFPQSRLVIYFAVMIMVWLIGMLETVRVVKINQRPTKWLPKAHWGVEIAFETRWTKDFMEYMVNFEENVADKI